MLPLVLDLSRLTLMLIGDGAAAERRLGLLDAAGAADLRVYAETPSAALALAAGSRLVPRLPTARELARARLVFISDRHAGYCDELAGLARALGALVHVEDAPALCDVQAPAVLRRGDLTIAVSTGGKSPGLAVQVKRFLGTLFAPGMAAAPRHAGDVAARLARARRRCRDDGALERELGQPPRLAARRGGGIRRGRARRDCRSQASDPTLTRRGHPRAAWS